MHPQAHHKDLLKMLTQLEPCDVPDAERTGPTARDLQEALPRMSAREFKVTMANLRRRGNVRIVTRTPVPYCNKPVAVYGLYVGDQPKTLAQHAESLALWASMPEAETTTAETAQAA